MLRDLEILNIDYSASNADYRRTETHKVKELNGRVLIPFEGPMFARNLVLRADGTPLTIEKDYELEDDFDELELMTGKKVIGSIRVSLQVLNDYKEVKISYQKVGEVIISRNFLLQSAETILHNTKPIDWLTQVFGKPDTFPPGFHTHDVREKSELVGFKDLLLIFKQASGQTKLHGLDLWNRLKVIEDKAFATLNSNYKEVWDKMFTHIMNTSKPHPMTKAELGLGNHPNYATATSEEDQKAALYKWDEKVNGSYVLRNDVISTPNGVGKAIENYEVDTDGFVRQGTLPFSYYGSGFYLPPPIKGSFEGLGSDLGSAAICLESNGVVTALIRGYDSKVKNLYYYYNDDIYSDVGKFTFSGIKYSHPLIESDNAALKQAYADSHGGNLDGYIPLEANHVIAGSSGLILCIGDREKSRYYIGLGNNTLDSNSHVLKRIDINDFTDPLEGNVFDSLRSCIMLIGDYVYFVAQTSRWPTTVPESAKFGTKNPSYRMRIFYRALKSDLSNPNTDTIKFRKQLMNYQDLEGNMLYNQSTVDFSPAVIGKTADGKDYCKSMWVDYTNPPDPDFNNILLSPYHCQWIFKDDPSRKNVAAIKFLHGIQNWYYGVRTVGENLHFAVPMTFDANTNTITVDKSWFKVGYNIQTAEWTVPDGKSWNSWYNGNISPFIGNFDEVNSVWVERIGICSIGTRAHGLPYSPVFWFSEPRANRGKGDQWELFNRDFGSGEYQSQAISMESPFGFASVPSLMNEVWDYNGGVKDVPLEVFRSLTNTSGLDTFYRIADDAEYVKRDDLKFSYVNKDIYARAPNSRFGRVRGENKTDLTRFLPSINLPIKDKFSTQYGMFRLTSKWTLGNYPVAWSELYAMHNAPTPDTSIGMENDGSFYLDTLGTHTVDESAGILTVAPDTSGRVRITKEFWRAVMSAMLGEDNGIITDNGIGNNSEYVMGVFLANPAAGKNIPTSFAMMYFHRVSLDPEVAKMTYMRAVTFDWSSAGNDGNGYKIAKLGVIKRIDNNELTTNISRNGTGKWSGTMDPNHQYPCTRPSVQISGTDRNNMDVWFSMGIQQGTVGSSCTPNFLYKVKNGEATFTGLYNGMYTLESTVGNYQAVHNGGLQNVVSGGASGGGAFYTARGDGAYTLVEAVFVKGNWTLFISTDLKVIFNGSTKTLKARNYGLDQLGIDPANKVFYLYAVCGKTEGYYDLSLSERTASPYHMLVAVITTISTGIKTIEVNQVFAISGFTINTSNKGGSVPATTGTFPENGIFEAIVKEDLFDNSNYQ